MCQLLSLCYLVDGWMALVDSAGLFQGGEGSRGNGDGPRGDDLESGLAPTGSHPVFRL